MKISSIQQRQNFQGALTWSELTIDVAPEAASGDRTLVLVLLAGRTAPVTLMIPTHVPNISELGVASRQSNPPTLDVQFSAVDASADLGSSPYVWFMFRCGGELVPGVVHGNLTARDKANGIVRVNVPKPPAPANSTNAATPCDLQVRVTDMGGIESNTLRTTIDLKN